jgi:hypothetical protein
VQHRADREFLLLFEQFLLIHAIGADADDCDLGFLKDILLYKLDEIRDTNGLSCVQTGKCISELADLLSAPVRACTDDVKMLAIRQGNTNMYQTWARILQPLVDHSSPA